MAHSALTARRPPNSVLAIIASSHLIGCMGRRSRCPNVSPEQRWGSGDAVAHLFHARVARTARAAEHLSPGLDAVPDDLAPAVLARRGQPVDGALEAVEDVVIAAVDDLEGLVVLVAAHLALW